MKREINVIRYLLDEIEERNLEIIKYENDHGCWDVKPARNLIVDNAKKIRQLALKISKEGKNL